MDQGLPQLGQRVFLQHLQKPPEMEDAEVWWPKGGDAWVLCSCSLQDGPDAVGNNMQASICMLAFPELQPLIHEDAGRLEWLHALSPLKCRHTSFYHDNDCWTDTAVDPSIHASCICHGRLSAKLARIASKWMHMHVTRCQR